MPQMLVDGPEIAVRSAQKVDAARMAEGMWMKLGQSCLLAQRLDQFAFEARAHDERGPGGSGLIARPRRIRHMWGRDASCGVWTLGGNCMISRRSTRRASMAAGLQHGQEDMTLSAQKAKEALVLLK
jgi:hypothetical protein